MKNLRLVCVLLTCLLFAGCSNPNRAVRAEPQKKLVNFDTSKIAVLPFDISRNFFLDKKVKQDTLSNDDLIIEEHLLDSTINKYNKLAEANYAKDLKKDASIGSSSNDDPRIDLSKYRRQLIIVKNSLGEKIVWVNCFIDDFTTRAHWKKYPVIVMDGGKWFFSLKINLTRRKVYDFNVHGVA